MTRYRKAWVAFAAAVVASIPIVWDQTITQEEAVTLASLWLGVLGVVLFPNEPAEDRAARYLTSERGATLVEVVAIAAATVFLLWLFSVNLSR